MVDYSLQNKKSLEYNTYDFWGKESWYASLPGKEDHCQSTWRIKALCQLL